MTPPAERRRALAATACAASLAIAGSALYATNQQPGPPRSTAAPTIAIAPQAGRPPAPRQPTTGALLAAHEFAADYGTSLSGALPARAIRHATPDLQRRIHAAGLRLSGRPRTGTLQLRVRALNAGSAAANGSLRVGDATIALTFVLSRDRTGWSVHDLGDPNDTTER